MMEWLMIGPAQAAAQSPFASILFPMSLMFLVFYLFLIRPARNRQKELDSLVDSLSKGDQVITNSGLYGKVVKVDGDIAVLEIADNVRIRVAKRAIGGLEGSQAENGGK